MTLSPSGLLLGLIVPPTLGFPSGRTEEVLLLLEDIELQQVPGYLPTEENFNIVDGLENVHTLLQCARREEFPGRRRRPPTRLLSSYVPRPESCK